MNEEMRKFMDGEYDDGMLDISVSCSQCGSELEIEVESLDGLVTLEECCHACMRQTLITYEIKNNEIVRLDVSNPDGNY